jgi:3-dehydro-L-gulonate 2-dehydrogenase
MRGGTYAWQAAEKGFMSINWINTESCMPMWGSKEAGVGNNPFCIGIPREDGPIVLDMAMSQYSYGKLGVYRLAGKRLPFPGGFDKEGNLTDDPSAIEESMRILPTGYWKGSGLSIALDMAAALMSNGLSGNQIDQLGKGSCGGCSQIFIAYDPYLFGKKEDIQEMLNDRVDAVHRTEPENSGVIPTCPGERTLKARERSKEKGVQVDDGVWKEVCKLAE